MNGYEVLPLLDQIMFGVMTIGATFGIMAIILLVATYAVIGTLFAFDLLLDWSLAGIKTEVEDLTERRWLFKHTDDEDIHLPYAHQIQVLEGVIVQ